MPELEIAVEDKSRTMARVGKKGKKCEEFFSSKLNGMTKTGNVLLARRRFDVRVKENAPTIRLCILFLHEGIFLLRDFSD